MSKPAKKSSSNLLYILLGVTVVVAAWLNMGDDSPKKKATAPLRNNARAMTASSVKSEVVFTEEDSTKTFPVYKAELKPAFKPIIARNQTDLVNGPSNQIPASFADGDASWVYTGSANIDGRVQGLLENTATGEGVFLSPGQRWKKLLCNSIRDDGMVVTGPDGDVRTIALLTEPKEDESGLTPLSGSIEVLPDPTAAQGGRRGRRNNGAATAPLDPTAGGGAPLAAAPAPVMVAPAAGVPGQ